MRRFALAFALLLLAGGGGLLGRRAYLEAKAVLARHLIEHAFEAHLRDGKVHRPWGWADTHPIALLEAPRLHVERFVLAGASGSSLAFGAGHVDGTAPPNTPGHCVIAGHRDREFEFLRDLREGDILLLRTAGGVREYAVDGVAIVERGGAPLLQQPGGARLTLLTCYPFGSLWRSARRYVVTAAARDRRGITISSSRRVISSAH